ncbi:MAG: DnaD domain protein [Lachnospiraceae bacterium]|nr:DnaD domain protein [Lachnospiraceae bacterium]
MKQVNNIMDQVTLNSDLCCEALVIPEAALEKCLREANESQIKIYLYLLKCGTKSPTVSSIADFFNYSEQDVKRALRFWNGKNKAEKAERADKVAKLMEKPEVSQLMFVAEKYMGRPIKPDEISSILYIYDTLGFPADLVEYLIEYCISNNKRSMHSIEEEAVSWKEAGVTTLNAAQKLTRHIPAEMKDVLKALGFPEDHQPVDMEIAFVRRWTGRYGYGMDIIGEACSRAVLATGKPNFRYANGILKKWHDAGVEKPADIVASEEDYRKKNAAAPAPKKETAKKSSTAKIHNFSERQYDYDSLMKDIIPKEN